LPVVKISLARLAPACGAITAARAAVDTGQVPSGSQRAQHLDRDCQEHGIMSTVRRDIAINATLGDITFLAGDEQAAEIGSAGFRVKAAFRPCWPNVRNRDGHEY
jgi:hypothetical protein